MGCPGGMSTFHLHFQALFGTFFLKVFLEQDCYGKKDPCAVFGCKNDRLFPEKYTVKDHISNIKHSTRIFLPITILF